MKSLGLLLLAGATAVPVGAVLWSRANRPSEPHAPAALEAVPGGAVPEATPARSSDDAQSGSRPLAAPLRLDLDEPELIVPAPPTGWRPPGAARRSLDDATPRTRGRVAGQASLPRPRLRTRPRSAARKWSWYRTQPPWRLIDELRDDDIRWNATIASGELHRRIWQDREHRLEVHEAALPWIAAKDTQLSLIAGGLVFGVADAEVKHGTPYWPTEALLEKTAAWLIERPAPESFGLGGVSNRYLVRFALNQVDALEPRLLEQVRRPAGRDVFLAAFVLGASDRWEHTDLLAPLLIPRLRSNDIAKDACMAQEALLTLGPGVIDHLEAARLDADTQQLSAIDALLWEFRSPTRTYRQALERQHLNQLTERYVSSVRSWRFRKSY